MGMVPLIIGAGLNTVDTTFAVHPMPTFSALPPGWVDMDKARFFEGQPQTIGGWETFVAAPLTGVCRSIQPWNDLTGTLNVAFGTHSNLEVVVGGVLSDITPTLALPPYALTANPLTTTSGTPNVTVAQPGHPYVVGDSNTLSGAVALGGITPNGTFTVTAVTTDTWTFAFGSNASSTATAGGAAVVVTPHRAFAAGAIDGTGGEGYGTGAYSVGGYSQPSTADFFPRTWSLANFGQELIANPRGGTIYAWANNVATPAAPLLNAPARVTAALVTPERQVVAIGCNDVLTGIFNPMNVRGSDLEDPTDWLPATANNAWEETLEGGGHLVSGRMVGDILFVWSDTCLWQAQFIGDPGQTYRFTKSGEGCGLIGPNAAVVVGQSAYWMSPDGNFRTCSLGGEPAILPSTLAPDLIDNMAPGQEDKIVATLIPKFGEVWWLYPDGRDGTEVSRYVGVSLSTGRWIHGTFDRTAFNAGSPAQYPIAVSKAGKAYLHEKGKNADGGPLAWFFESGAQYLGNADQRFQIKSLWPDFQEQEGPVSVTVFGRDYPQGVERTKGPFMLSPGQSKRDLLMDARLVRVRIAGSSVPSFCRLGRLQFDGVGTGLQ